MIFFSAMYNKHQESPLAILKDYLGNGASLRQTAASHGIHYQTLYKWTKVPVEKREDYLRSWYRRPWNRTEEEQERKIALLKEGDPTLTLKQTQEVLAQKGIRISIKGIWGIWKRYGYAGFNKERISNDFTDHCQWSPESRCKYDQAKVLMDDGAVEEAAKLLNSIPVLPNNDLIAQIPDNLLNLRRRVEKVKTEFGSSPMRSFVDKARALHNECLERNFRYLALRAGVSEITAMSWYSAPQSALVRTIELKRLIKKRGKHHSSLLFAPTITLAISEGIALGGLAEIRAASLIARRCKTLLKRRKHVSCGFMINLGAIFTQFEDYRDAEFWFSRALRKSKNEKVKQGLRSSLAGVYLMNGDYRKSLRMLKKASLHGWIDEPKELFHRAMLEFMDGKPRIAIAHASKGLSLSKKIELKIGIIKANMAIASAYASLGEKAKARRVLKNLILFSKKTEVRASDALEVLLSDEEEVNTGVCEKSDDLAPSKYIAIQLKRKRYERAYEFAERKGILAYLHRFVFFAPESVRDMLAKGKRTHLPKPVLQLPIFNRDIPTYNVRFLGKLVVYKNQQYLGVELSPKDTAFLVHLAMRAGEPDKRIYLEDIFRNFWRNSTNPSRNLSHLLVRIRKALRLPTHLLEVSYSEDAPCLVNRGIHFITDYDEFQQMITQAKALTRVGQWRFARQEYGNALRLFRGEPFTRMYDDWSDDKRLEVIFSFESAAILFLKELVAKDQRNTAKRLFGKLSKIIPYSEEMEKVLEDCQV